MIFFRRSYLRAAASKKRSGQITLWLCLSFLVFLGLYLACFQSVRKQSQRRQAEQAAETGMFSLFSEFEPHLLADYDLFYLDTSFRKGTEQQEELCSHLWHFIRENISDVRGAPLNGLKLQGVNVKNLVRATDGGGMVFYQQAVRVMKERTGFSLAEDWFLQEGVQEELEENSRKFQEDREVYSGIVRDYEDEEEELSAEAYEWEGLTDSFTLSMAVPDKFTVSDKAVNLSAAPSHRTLSDGAGTAAGNEDSLLQKQWFISYLCEYMKNAPQMLSQQPEDGYLDYQLEYVLCGNSSDRENLEQVLHRLLLMREGVNYVFLLTHSDLSIKAETLAKVLVGFTGNMAMIEGMKHLILLGWAYGESLVEVRQLLGGYELALLKSEEDWQVPLSGLLSLIGDPGKYDEQKRPQQGISYKSCLRGFLTLRSAKTLAMRGLDVIEGELQRQPGCEKIHLDHCVEELTAQVWMDGIYLERTYGYE